MNGLSNHTRLMNIILCLANKNKKYVPVLYDNDYVLESIELAFNMQNKGMIHTDVCLKNLKLNNLVLIECKDGGLELDQARRYATLNRNDIIKACVTTLSGDFSHEVVYVGCKDKSAKLIGDIQENSFSFPTLISDETKVKLESNSFNCQVLQKIFTENGGADTPNPLPVFYYPFGKDDSDAYILSNISPVLIGLRGKEFDVEDVIETAHKLYEYIDDSSLKDLKGRVRNLLNNISKNGLNEFFDLPSNKKYKLKSFGIMKFQHKLEKYIEEFSRLDRFLNKPESKPATEQKTLAKQIY